MNLPDDMGYEHASGEGACPGGVVNRASDGYRGEGKTDPRDAFVLADQARIRRDLQELRPSGEAIIELRLLTSRRADVVRDRTRSINRLRSALTGMFPALERALVLTTAAGVQLTAQQPEVNLVRVAVEGLGAVLGGTQSLHTN